MKNLTIQLIVCLLLSYTLSAIPVTPNPQDTIKEKKTLTLEWGDDEDHDHHKSDGQTVNIRSGMLDFGISTYLSDGSLDLPDELSTLDQVLWRSMNIGLHIVNVRANFSGNDKPAKLNLTTGLKLNWAHYSMQQDYNLIRNQPSFEAALDFNVPELKKNRLRATYLQIPVLLEFTSNPTNAKQSINLGVGYVHQFLLGSQYKYKTTDGVKQKARGDYNLRKSMGMIEARVGVSHLNFFVQYGLSHLFQDDNGPELTPINFGINLIPR